MEHFKKDREKIFQHSVLVRCLEAFMIHRGFLLSKEKKRKEGRKERNKEGEISESSPG